MRDGLMLQTFWHVLGVHTSVFLCVGMKRIGHSDSALVSQDEKNRTLGLCPGVGACKYETVDQLYYSVFSPWLGCAHWTIVSFSRSRICQKKQSNFAQSFFSQQSRPRLVLTYRIVVSSPSRLDQVYLHSNVVFVTFKVLQRSGRWGFVVIAHEVKTSLG